MRTAVSPAEIAKCIEQKLSKSGFKVRRRPHRPVRGHKAIELKVGGAARDRVNMVL